MEKLEQIVFNKNKGWLKSKKAPSKQRSRKEPLMSRREFQKNRSKNVKKKQNSSDPQKQ